MEADRRYKIDTRGGACVVLVNEALPPRALAATFDAIEADLLDLAVARRRAHLAPVRELEDDVPLEDEAATGTDGPPPTRPLLELVSEHTP